VLGACCRKKPTHPKGGLSLRRLEQLRWTIGSSKTGDKEGTWEEKRVSDINGKSAMLRKEGEDPSHDGTGCGADLGAGKTLKDKKAGAIGLGAPIWKRKNPRMLNRKSSRPLFGKLGHDNGSKKN